MSQTKNEPRLGIFWLIEGRMTAFHDPLSQCDAVGVHIDYPIAHVDAWLKVQRLFPDLAESTHDAVPRGRVPISASISARSFAIAC